MSDTELQQIVASAVAVMTTTVRGRFDFCISGESAVD